MRKFTLFAGMLLAMFLLFSMGNVVIAAPAADIAILWIDRPNFACKAAHGDVPHDDASDRPFTIGSAEDGDG